MIQSFRTVSYTTMKLTITIILVCCYIYGVISAPERLDRDGHPKKLEHVCPPEQHPQDQCLNELSCNNVLNISKPTSSISLALSYCENGCACNPGYARSIDGRTCVQKSDCHQSQINLGVISAPKESTEGEHKCPPQQHSQEQCWNELSCAHVVDNHEPPTGPIALTFNPCRNGCTCDSGYARTFDKTECIPKEDCYQNEIDYNDAYH